MTSRELNQSSVTKISAKISKYLEIYPWIKEKITKDIRKCFDLNENKNIIYQNLWNATKAVLSA